jgi:protein gp37
VGDKVKKLEYGIATKAWHPLIGCSPHMPCAERCWACGAMGRVIECQTPRLEKGYAGNPERVEFFRQALTPDLKQWSGKVLIDEQHLGDPLKWRKPALIACGFHGDWGRLPDVDKLRLLQVIQRVPQHRFILLTKQPEAALSFAVSWCLLHGDAIPNITIGCSVMDQTEADRQRPAMAALAAMGWHTHCWNEPAVGPVNWKGWEFLELLVCGGESGKDSRPMNPTWARNARDWCAANGVAFRFKQVGDWTPATQENYSAGKTAWVWHDNWGVNMVCVGKRLAGNLLDGQEHNGLPDWMRV